MESQFFSQELQNGIHKPEELIQKIVDGQVPVHHEEGGRKESSSANGSVGSRIYKHLMNGVSHMLPFVIGGGILTSFLHSLTTDTLRIWCNRWIQLRFHDPALSILQVCRWPGDGRDGSGACRIYSRVYSRQTWTCGWFPRRYPGTSGNAALSGYVWAGDNLGGFQSFISKFGFVAEGGGNK